MEKVWNTEYENLYLILFHGMPWRQLKFALQPAASRTFSKQAPLTFLFHHHLHDLSAIVSSKWHRSRSSAIFRCHLYDVQDPLFLSAKKHFSPNQMAGVIIFPCLFYRISGKSTITEILNFFAFKSKYFTLSQFLPLLSPN